MAPNLKMRVIPKFPAQVVGGDAIALTKANGVYTIDFDPDELVPIGSLGDPDNSYIPVLLPDGSLARLEASALSDYTQFVDVTIPSAQVLTLNATPQTIVPAPGPGLTLVFEGAVIHKPAGVAYAGIAAGEDLAIKQTNAAGAQRGGCETTGFLDQATAQTRYVRPFGEPGSGLVSQITPVENTPLVLHMLVGEITTGNSDLRLRVFYRVVPFTL